MYRKHVLAICKRNISCITRTYQPNLYSGIYHTQPLRILVEPNRLIISKQCYKLAAAHGLLSDVKHFHTHNSPVRKDPESKAEQTAQMLKEKMITSDRQVADLQKTPEAVRLSLWGRIVKECKHYYNGFKLLYLETKIALRLLRHVLEGIKLDYTNCD